MPARGDVSIDTYHNVNLNWVMTASTRKRIIGNDFRDAGSSLGATHRLFDFAEPEVKFLAPAVYSTIADRVKIGAVADILAGGGRPADEGLRPPDAPGAGRCPAISRAGRDPGEEILMCTCDVMAG